MHVIISRTDNIGDVVLTLPVCAAIRKQFPNYKISFLGKDYTRAVVEACHYVDGFISYNELSILPQKQAAQRMRSLNADCIIFIFPEAKAMKWAAAAQIPIRIATSGRWHSWIYCNRQVVMSRKRSQLHEAQLNFKLLAPIGIREIPSLQKLSEESYINGDHLSDNVNQILLKITEGKRIIIHALGVSGVDWPLQSFVTLAQLLRANGFEVIFTGTESDGIVLRKHLPSSAGFHDVTGKFSLSELIQFIGQCQCLVACSTGPLHIAASMGITSIGLFSPHRPIHPGRWAPIGPRAHYLCATASHKNELDIPVERVYQFILSALH